MFCPNCGQEQLAPNVRFCSRCRFVLTGVDQLLQNDGLIENIPGFSRPDAARYTKIHGIVFSIAWFITFTMFFTSIFAILDLDRIVPLTAVFGFFSSILMLILSITFLPFKNTSPSTEALYAQVPQPELYAPQQQQYISPPTAQSEFGTPPPEMWKTGGFIQNETKEITEEKTRMLHPNE